MKKALWFGRAKPAEPQLEEANLLGFQIVEIQRGRRLAHVNMRNRDDLQKVTSQLEHLSIEWDTNVVFGVIPPPLLEHLKGYDLYASWSVEDRDLYHHRRWCKVSSSSTRAAMSGILT